MIEILEILELSPPYTLVTDIYGPLYPTAGQSYTAGARFGQAFSAGATAGAALVPVQVGQAFVPGESAGAAEVAGEDSGQAI
jgi:hypothetical protein